MPEPRGLHVIAAIGEEMLAEARKDPQLADMPRRSVLYALGEKIEDRLGPFATDLEAKMLMAYLHGRIIRPQPAINRDLNDGREYVDEAAS